MSWRQIIRELERYRAQEAAGLLLHLPAPLGTPVWIVHNNPACHAGVREAEKFLFGKVLTPRKVVSQVPFTVELLALWGQTVFRTEQEGRRAIDIAAESGGSAPLPGQGQPGPGGLL